MPVIRRVRTQEDQSPGPRSFSVAMTSLVRVSVAAHLGCLLVSACGEEEPPYRKVAQGQYAEVWQSADLEGRVCSGGAAAVDRQIEKLGQALRVTVPEDYRLVALVEPDHDAVRRYCGSVDVEGCFKPLEDGTPAMASSKYLGFHETVHALQRLRGGRPHFALREGEATMFADLVDSIASTHFCPSQPIGDEALHVVLDEQFASGAYGVFHEIVARVYQDHGSEAFDALWAASAADRSTEGLLAAFEDVLGTTLFELMEQPSLTCRHQIPGCAGLERLVLESDGLTIDVPETCGPGITGLEPGRLFRSFVLELPEAGELAVAFSGGGFAVVHLGACDGFDIFDGYARFSTTDEEHGTALRFDLDAGLYRAFVMGNTDDPSGEAHFELTPSAG